MFIVFWVSSFLVVYSYVIYPLLLWALRRTSSKAVLQTDSDDQLPTVCVVVSAFNEESIIAQKLDNFNCLTYPKHLINLVVISDASDDKTDQIVLSHSNSLSNVTLHRQEQRLGKTEGINQAMKNITSDIVVFSDANSMYEPNAINELVKHFEHDDVGFVVGSALYVDEQENASAKSEGLYWKYECAIKLMESDFHSVVGGDGAIYAIRSELFWPLKQTDINDFVNPLQIVANGYRGVFSNTARCYEYASESFEKEFSRKRRIVNRSWRAVTTYWHMFNLRRDALFIFSLLSHKVVRWYALLFILLALLSSAFIAFTESSILYSAFFSLILLSMLLAWGGKYLDSKGTDLPILIYIPYYFYFVNLASMLGIFDNFRGRTYSIWDHIRS